MTGIRGLGDPLKVLFKKIAAANPAGDPETIDSREKAAILEPDKLDAATRELLATQGVKIGSAENFRDLNKDGKIDWREFSGSVKGGYSDHVFVVSCNGQLYQIKQGKVADALDPQKIPSLVENFIARLSAELGGVEDPAEAKKIVDDLCKNFIKEITGGHPELIEGDVLSFLKGELNNRFYACTEKGEYKKASLLAYLSQVSPSLAEADSPQDDRQKGLLRKFLSKTLYENCLAMEKKVINVDSKVPLSRAGLKRGILEKLSQEDFDLVINCLFGWRKDREDALYPKYVAFILTSFLNGLVKKGVLTEQQKKDLSNEISQVDKKWESEPIGVPFFMDGTVTLTGEIDRKKGLSCIGFLMKFLMETYGTGELKAVGREREVDLTGLTGENLIEKKFNFSEYPAVFHGNRQECLNKIEEDVKKDGYALYACQVYDDKNKPIHSFAVRAEAVDGKINIVLVESTNPYGVSRDDFSRRGRTYVKYGLVNLIPGETKDQLKILSRNLEGENRT